MDPNTVEEGTRGRSRSAPRGGIRIGVAPGEKGGHTHASDLVPASRNNTGQSAQGPATGSRNEEHRWRDDVCQAVTHWERECPSPIVGAPIGQSESQPGTPSIGPLVRRETPQSCEQKTLLATWSWGSCRTVGHDDQHVGKASGWAERSQLSLAPDGMLVAGWTPGDTWEQASSFVAQLPLLSHVTKHPHDH